MNHVQEYLKKRFSTSQVWILGVGREGLSTYTLLRKYLPDLPITLIDDLPLESLEYRATQFSSDKYTKFILSTEATAPSPEVVVFKTPGIPLTHPLLLRLEKADVQLTSNTQVFFDLLKEMPQPPVTIGVTGTKGKSTTTSIIHHVLKENGKTAFLAGNIGTPALDLVDEIFSLEKPSTAYIVLELSSHQLHGLTSSPTIAVVQNITSEHLDYYPDFETYQNSKQSITEYQNENEYVIFCPKFDAVLSILSGKSQHLMFDVEPTTTEKLTAYATTDAVYYGSERVMAVTEVPLVGKHNLYNVLPSLIIGHLAKLSSEQIAQAIRSFKGLPHRLEFVAEVAGVTYYNDSQATTPEAAIAALTSFSGTPLHVLAGGSDKGVHLGLFIDEVLRNQVKSLVLFPPMGEVMHHLLQQRAKPGQATPTVFHVHSMAEAVKIAKEQATAGEVVLLSPACASFGLFKNYQDRGNRFKTEVKKLSHADDK